MKAVILAAGEGTRLRPLTYVMPKPLVPVLSTPLIVETITKLAASGVRDFLIVTKYMEDTLKQYLGDGSQYGVSLSYLTQGPEKGTGAATRIAREFVGDSPFFLSFADLYISPENYPSLLSAYERFGQPDLMLTVYEVDDPCHGAAVYETEGRVEKVLEKPAPGTSTTNWMNAGLFCAQPVLFDYLDALTPSERGEYELPDAFNQMIAEGRPVYATPLTGVWSDLGRPQQVLLTDGQAMRHDMSLVSRPDPMALVHIGAQAEVGACHFEGIVSIAGKTEVESGCKLVNCAILGDAYLETACELVNCLVAPGVYVKSGERHIGSADEPVILMPTGYGL